MTQKHKCDKCSRMAIWYYVPSGYDYYYCDDCVPRGCSCNINPETDEEYRDEQNRLLPCCEYMDDTQGFDVTPEEFGEEHYDDDYSKDI